MITWLKGLTSFFKEREADWWVYTLLPIILILFFAFLVFLKIGEKNEFFIMLIEQFLLYSIILSSTDVGLRSKSLEIKQRTAPPLLIIILAAIALTFFYTNKDVVINRLWIISIYFMGSLITSFLSILLYYKNPESSIFAPQKFTDQKARSEAQMEKEFKSPKRKTSIKKIKWGKNNE